MIAVPFALAFGFGYTVFGLVHRRRPGCFSDLMLIMLMGIGISAQLAFYQVLFCNGFNATVLQAAGVVLLLALFMLMRRMKMEAGPLPIPPAGYSLYFLLSIAVFVAILAVLLINNPYGNWDAWSYWNMKARHILSSGPDWKDAYTYSFQAKHPGLLVDWILTGWAWSGEGTLFPMLNAWICVLLMVALLVYSLKEWTKSSVFSLLAGAFLGSIPFFLVHSCSQYADLLAAWFLLSAILTVLRLLQNPQKSNAVWTGVLLGLMAFNKDEGIIAAAILLFLIHWHCVARKQRGILKPLYLALMIASIPTILAKIWMLPAPEGLNAINPQYWHYWKRWAYVFEYLWKAVTSETYSGVLLAAGLLFACRLKTPFDETAKFLFKFFFLYCSVFLLLYEMVKVGLNWRLETTMFRLIYQILPSFMFLLFYCLNKACTQENRSCRH